MTDDTGESRDSPPPGRKPRSSGFGWPLAFAVVALATLLSGLYIFDSLRRIPSGIADSSREVLSDLTDLAAAFNQGTVRTSFLSYATTMSGNSYFQFATLDEMEVFEREDYASTLWGQLELPEVVVSATAPVQYTYFVDLEGNWDFTLEDNHVIVRAPRIEFNKPAVDASSIEYEVKRDSWFRDEAGAQEQLRRGITAMAHRRAQENVALVRELGRRKTAEFVETWLLESYARPERPWDVEVIFADEEVPLLRPPQFRPAEAPAEDGDSD